MGYEEFLDIPEDDHLPPLSQAEVDEYIHRHKEYLAGQQGGARAVLKFKDLSGLDFKDCDLSGADFTGSRLAGADFSFSNLEYASFFTADMRYCTLFSANLTRTDLRGAYLAGANMTSANLEKADMREGRVMTRDKGGVLKNHKETSAATILSGARLKGANLKDVDGRNCNMSDVDLSGANIRQADFEGANFTKANLSDSDLSNSKLNDANLSGAVTANMRLYNTEMFRVNAPKTRGDLEMGHKLETLGKPLEQLLEDHHDWVSSIGLKGTQLDLSNFDLRNITALNRFELTAIKALGANFIGQILRGVHLQYALLDRCDFRDCDLKDADFRASSLKYALFSRSNLKGANFSPLYFDSEGHITQTKFVDLTGADFRYCDVRGVNFTDATLAGADFSHALIEGADFKGCTLDDALFKGCDMKDLTHFKDH